MPGKQGFASMDREKQRKIAAMGGAASHGGRNKNKKTSESAREERGQRSR